MHYKLVNIIYNLSFFCMLNGVLFYIAYNFIITSNQAWEILETAGIWLLMIGLVLNIFAFSVPMKHPRKKEKKLSTITKSSTVPSILPVLEES
jgi:hypothetical protein